MNIHEILMNINDILMNIHKILINIHEIFTKLHFRPEICKSPILYFKKYRSLLTRRPASSCEFVWTILK